MSSRGAAIARRGDPVAHGKRFRVPRGCFVAALLAMTTSLASAQTYPTKPVRIVTTEAGSANDVVARMISQKLSPTLGQQLIVDNRGIIAGEIVSRAAPDGYTVLSYGSP